MFHQIVTNADGVRQRHARNEGEGLEDALAHFIVLTTAVLHRDGRAAAYAEAQQDAAGDGAGCQCTLHGDRFLLFLHLNKISIYQFLKII